MVHPRVYPKGEQEGLLIMQVPMIDLIQTTLLVVIIVMLVRRS